MYRGVKGIRCIRSASPGCASSSPEEEESGGMEEEDTLWCCGSVAVGSGRTFLTMGTVDHGCIRYCTMGTVDSTEGYPPYRPFYGNNFYITSYQCTSVLS